MERATLLEVFSEREDYRTYLKAAIEARAKGSRGLKHRLAQALGCQGAFVSQVLGRHAHFHLEHGEKVNAFLGHTEEEGHYFLLLLQKTRAGTVSLRAYFDRQLQEIVDRRLVMKNRFKLNEALSVEDQSRYYSAWYYGAMRVALTVPALRKREALAKRLQLPLSKVSEVLDWLVSRGLADERGGEYFPTEVRMHLGNDSAMIAKHHGNWRARALVSLDLERALDLHYSSVITIAAADAPRLKEITIRFLEQVKALVKDSPAEDLYSFNLDFFGL